MTDKKTSSSKGLVDILMTTLLRGVSKDSNALHQILALVAEHKLIGQATRTMLKGALQITDMDVRDIMIPRVKMTWVPEGATLGEALHTAAQSGHARLPVLNEEKDTVAGMLLAKDMLAEVEDNRDMDSAINGIMRAPMFVPESKLLHILLQEFQSNHVHMAIVVNEYGGTAGLVTIEDIIEEIIGDIKDEHDSGEDSSAFIHDAGNGKYIIDALLPIDEFNSYFTTTFDDSEYETVSGLVLDSFGRLPAAGDKTEIGDMRFLVLDADKKRLLKLELQKKPSRASK